MLFSKAFLVKNCSSFEYLSRYKILFSHVDQCVLIPPQEFEFPPFWNGQRQGLRLTESRSPLNSVNFVQVIPKAKMGTRTDRQNYYLKSLTILSKGHGLKMPPSSENRKQDHYVACISQEFPRHARLLLFTIFVSRRPEFSKIILGSVYNIKCSFDLHGKIIFHC